MSTIGFKSSLFTTSSIEKFRRLQKEDGASNGLDLLIFLQMKTFRSDDDGYILLF